MNKAPWWPLGLHWSLAGQVPKRAVAVARPASTDEVGRVLAACNEAGVPVTAAGGRSGVCGASAPVFGGGEDSGLEPIMLFTLLFGFFIFTLTYVLLLRARNEQSVLEDEIEQLYLQRD